MSYGWLTESSCIPKPGKEILSVSKQSLVSLKALLVEEEVDKLKRRHTKTTWKNRNKKLPITQKDDKKKKIISHSVKRDKANDVLTSHDPPFCYDALEKKLEKKAEIYDSLVSGKLDIQDVSNVLDPCQKSKNKQSQRFDQLCLNIEKKHQLHDTPQNDGHIFCKEAENSTRTKSGAVEKQASQVLQQLRDRLEKLSSKKRTE